jgi:hypothetical protein
MADQGGADRRQGRNGQEYQCAASASHDAGDADPPQQRRRELAEDHRAHPHVGAGVDVCTSVCHCRAGYCLAAGCVAGGTELTTL